MTIFLILLIFVIVFFYLSKKQERLIQHGRFIGSKHLAVNQHEYYIEEVKFKGYQETLHKFYQIVADINKLGKAIELKYDLYDWTYSLFRFKDTTIELRHLRSFNKVQLIKSKEPIGIKDFEYDISKLYDSLNK